MRKYYIYKIECTDNGKVYIGQTCDLQRRKREHFNDLKTINIIPFYYNELIINMGLRLLTIHLSKNALNPMQMKEKYIGLTVTIQQINIKGLTLMEEVVKKAYRR